MDGNQPGPDENLLGWDGLDYGGENSSSGRVLRTIFVDVLGLESECLNPRFVRWLIGGKDLIIEGVLLDVGNLRLSYQGRSRDGVLPHRTFEADTMSRTWALRRMEISQIKEAS